MGALDRKRVDEVADVREHLLAVGNAAKMPREQPVQSKGTGSRDGVEAAHDSYAAGNAGAGDPAQVPSGAHVR